MLHAASLLSRPLAPIKSTSSITHRGSQSWHAFNGIAYWSDSSATRLESQGHFTAHFDSNTGDKSWLILELKKASVITHIIIWNLPKSGMNFICDRFFHKEKMKDILRGSTMNTAESAPEALNQHHINNDSTKLPVLIITRYHKLQEILCAKCV